MYINNTKSLNNFKATFDIKSYPEQKPKCLKLTKSYSEKKKQYIDCAFSAF